MTSNIIQSVTQLIQVIRYGFSHLSIGCLLGLNHLLLHFGHKYYISLDLLRPHGDGFMSLVSIDCLDSNIILIHSILVALVDCVHIRYKDCTRCPTNLTIFVNPRWYYVLPPHLHQAINWEYYWQLIYQLQDIHVQQTREIWKLRCQFFAPTHIALSCHGSFILCCVVSIIQFILIVS